MQLVQNEEGGGGLVANAKSLKGLVEWAQAEFGEKITLGQLVSELRAIAGAPDPKPRDFMDYEQLSARINIPVGTLYNWVHENKIPHVRLSERTVRFDPEEVEAWLRKGRCKGRA